MYYLENNASDHYERSRGVCFEVEVLNGRPSDYTRNGITDNVILNSYMVFPIINTDQWQSYADEQMGTKQKMWLRDPDGVKYLFKYPRQGFGEDWAEKAAAEIAEMLGIPHAQVELATFRGERGTISRSFMEGQDGSLWHGNQLLETVLSEYDKTKNFGQSAHTYHRITEIISGLGTIAPYDLDDIPAKNSGLACFTGYIVLDALISNTDRHHENWALILTFLRNEDETISISEVKMAPTFDHASSLGRELSDGRRALLLQNTQQFERYCLRCPSRIYWDEADNKPKHPIELVRLAASESPELFHLWLDRVATIDIDAIATLFSSFPGDRISSVGITFALRLIERNLIQLKDISRSLEL